MFRQFTSLRSRLLLAVVVLTLLPAAALMVQSALRGVREETARRQSDALRHSKLAAARLEQYVEGTRQVLAGLATAEAVRTGNAEACNQLLVRIQPHYPQFDNCGMLLPEGTVFASGVPFEPGVSVRNQPWFQEALATRKFTCSEYRVAPIVNRPAINFAYPITDDDGNVQRVLFATLSVKWLGEQWAAETLPPDAVLTVLDRDGTVLSRSQDAAQWVGKDFPDAPLVSNLLARASGSAEIHGLDGVPRLYAYATAGSPTGAFHVAVGIPQQVAWAKVATELRWNLLLLAAVLALALAAAWWTTETLVMRPVHALMRMANDLANGNLSSRTRINGSQSELAQLSRAFNGMADKLTERITQYQQAEATAHQRLQFEKLLASMSARLVDLAGFDSALPAALAEIGQFCDADRVYVFLLRDGNAVIDNTHEWCAPGISPQQDTLQNLPVSAYPWWMEKLRKSEAIHIQNVSQLPAEAAAERALLERQNIKSLLALPLLADDRLVGFVGLDNVRSSGTWRDEDRHLLHVAADVISRTIARQQAKDELRMIRARMERVLAESPVIVYALNVDGDRLAPSWISENITALFGVPLAEAYQPDWWMTHIHPDDRARALADQQDLLAAGSNAVREFRFQHQNGTYHWIHDQQRLIRDAAGCPMEILGAWEDITEYRTLTEQFQQAQKMEAVGRLAGGVAHDFNNLLNVILGYSELLQRRAALKPQDKTMLEEIHKAGERAGGLTRQLLAFSRKQVLEPKILDINHVVHSLTKMLYRLIGEDIKLTTVLGADIGRIKADRGQIEQVLMNMAVNARDAMPRGGELTLATATMELDAAAAHKLPEGHPGRYVVLTVSDTGTGMTDEVKSHLFEPFFTTKGLGKGTGLGLATCYGIVKQSGGFIHVESAAGHGSSFHVYLPTVTESVTPAVAAPAVAPPPAKPTTILLVEDDATVRYLGQTLLMEMGHRVLVAGNGEEALRMLEQQSHDGVDLVMTDVVMPGMSGAELAERLRGSHPTLKVLFTSGYTEDMISQHGVLHEQAFFLQKPYTGASLSAKLREVLDGQPRR